jgi:hypothetical protein
MVVLSGFPEYKNEKTLSLIKATVYWKRVEDLLKRRDLVPIDSTPLRKKAVKDLKSTIKKVDKAKLEINEYYEISKPEFQNWYNSELSAINKKVEKAEEKFFELSTMVREIFAYAEFHNIHPALAYHYIKEREKTAPEDREFDPFFDEEEPGYWEEEDKQEQSSRKGRNSSDSEEDNWEDLFNDFKSSMGEDSEKPSEMQKQAKEIEKTRIFRTIAKYLHPDKNKEQTKEEKENWLVALKNYTDNNLTALKDVLTWIRISKEELSDEVSIGELLSLQKKHKNDLKDAQKQIRKLKSYPDWDFTKVSKMERRILKQEFKEELESDYVRIYYETEKIEYLLQSWKQYRKSISRK